MTEVIPNPSFEQIGRTGPRHWTLNGGSAHQYVGSGEAHSGQNCILLKPTGSRLSWQSEPIPIRSQARYGLSWWTRLDGGRPWHWTYLTRFTGIEVDYLSADGVALDSHKRRLNCLRTSGWVRAWTVLDAPKAAAKMTVAFVLDSSSHIQMCMYVNDVELEEIPSELPEGFGRLRLWAYEDHGREPTFARFSVSGPAGSYFFPRYSYPFKNGRFYHVNDPSLNVLDLPAGRYKANATRGPGYTAAEREIAVSPGTTSDARLVLRKQQVGAEGEWHGGDHHVHLFFHKDSVHPQMTIEDVMKIAKGEGLNYVSFCGEWSEFTGNLGNHEIARSENFVGEVGLESVNDFYGHLCTLNWSHVPRQGIPMRCVPWPMNLDTIESLEEMGGAWTYAHPFDRVEPSAVIEAMANPQRLSCARELPVILALGHRANLDILCHADPGGAKLITEEYYRLLNMGFKIGITASTDFYVDQAKGTPGHNRTYVRSPSLDFASIAEAYRAGRTFATNGPLVDFQINGCKIGDELDLPPGRHLLRARLVAFSRMGLERARVIVNGKVLRTVEARGDWMDEQFDLPVEQSSWAAVHVEGPVDDDIEPWDLTPDQRNLQSQFAHTSPIYIRVAGRPMRPSREDVNFLIQWLDASRKAFHAQEKLWEGHPEEPYLASSYSKEDRERITAAFEQRVRTAKESLLGLIEGEASPR